MTILRESRPPAAAPSAGLSPSPEGKTGQGVGSVRGIFAGWNLVQRFAMPVTYPLTRTFVVVGTGVDPVTSRFSGARSTN